MVNFDGLQPDIEQSQVSLSGGLEIISKVDRLIAANQFGAQN